MKRVAVVILNWNGKDFLQKFLPSVLSSCSSFNREQTTFKAEVVVADNASCDSSKEVFSSIVAEGKKGNISADCHWIGLDKNYGFTGGYNRAISILAKGSHIGKNKSAEGNHYDYYVLLNSDVHTPNGWLLPLLSFIDENAHVGVCQPKILSYSSLHSFDKSDIYFEYAGASGGFIDRYGFPFCRGRILSHIEKDGGQYDTPIRTFWATGACMVVSSALWEKLQGFDEAFFAHMEEIDFCWRAALCGYQIWSIPQSAVYHVGGGTLPNNSPRKLFFNYRNNLLMLRKNLPAKGRCRVLFIRKVLDGLSALAYLLQFKFSFALAVLRGHKDYNRLKKSIVESPREKIFEDKDSYYKNIYGIYRHSIVAKFFMGKREYSQL